MEFKNKISQDLQGLKSIVDMPDNVNDLVKAYNDSQSYIGSSIRIPSDEASAEDLQAFNEKIISKSNKLGYKLNMDDEVSVNNTYQQLGAYDSADKYFDFFKEQNKETEFNADAITELSTFAKENRLTNNQFKALADKVITDTNAKTIDVSKVQEDKVNTLKKELGMTYDDVITKATKLSDIYLGGKDVNSLDNELIQSLGKIYDQLDDNKVTTLANEARHVSSEYLTPSEATRQHQDIMGNSNHPYFTATGADKQTQIDRMSKLLMAMHGQK